MSSIKVWEESIQSTGTVVIDITAPGHFDALWGYDPDSPWCSLGDQGL